MVFKIKILTILLIFFLPISARGEGVKKVQTNNPTMPSISIENLPICRMVYVEFYPNGKIKEKMCQGSYNAMGTFVSDRYEYDFEGNLIYKTYYHPAEFGKDYRIEWKYDGKGNMIYKKIYGSSGVYENDSEEVLDEIPE